LIVETTNVSNDPATFYHLKYAYGTIPKPFRIELLGWVNPNTTYVCIHIMLWPIKVCLILNLSST